VSEETLARRALKAAQKNGRQMTPMQVQRFLRQRGFEEEVIGRMIRVDHEIEEVRHEE